MADKTTLELIEAAREGDSNALETLLAQNQDKVYRFGLKMCGDPEDALDVLQETLLAVVRGVGEFRGAASLSTWLFTIARSFCIKKRRKGKSEPERICSIDSGEAQDLRTLADNAPKPDELIAARQLEVNFDRAISELDHKYREVLLLRDVEGLTASEVSQVLGLSEAAVKSRLHRARLHVRQALTPFLEQSSVEDAGRLVENSQGKCPDVLLLLSRHLEGEIGPETCMEMEKHIESCSRCASACESLRSSLALCRSVSGGTVPESVREAVAISLKGFIESARCGGDKSKA